MSKRKSWRQVLRSGIESSGHKTYGSYLASEHWKSTRKRFRRSKLSNGKCYCCGSRKDLQIHHRSYRSFGKENLNHLQQVCGKCHKMIHLNCAIGSIWNGHKKVKRIIERRRNAQLQQQKAAFRKAIAKTQQMIDSGVILAGRQDKTACNPDERSLEKVKADLRAGGKEPPVRNYLIPPVASEITSTGAPESSSHTPSMFAAPTATSAEPATPDVSIQ